MLHRSREWFGIGAAALAVACSAPPRGPSRYLRGPDKKTWLSSATCRNAGEASLHPVMIAEGQIEVSALHGGPIFLHADGLLTEVTDQGVAAPGPFGDRLPLEPMVRSQLLVSLAGRWPDALFLTVSESEHIPNAPDFPKSWAYRWKGDRWEEAPFVTDAMPWRGGVLALRKTLEVEGARVEPPAVDPQICPTALSALPSGEALVAGTYCVEKTFRVQRFGPGDTTGTLADLPMPLVCATGRIDGAQIASTGAGPFAGSWVWGVAHDCEGLRAGEWVTYLAGFDGKEWTIDEAEHLSRSRSISAAPDGSVWNAAHDLWRRPPGGAWEKVPLPCVSVDGEDIPASSAYPVQVIARSMSDVWAVVRYRRSPVESSPLVLLRSKKPERVLRLTSQ